MSFSCAAVASFARQMSTHFNNVKPYSLQQFSSYALIKDTTNESIADKVIFQGSMLASFGERSECSDVSIDCFCLFLLAVVEFISLIDDVCFPDAMCCP